MERQRLVKIDAPEFKREMAELQDKVKELNLTDLSAQIDRKALEEMQ
jgi:hypothetical protein